VKSPRDASMVVAAVATAILVVGLASVTSGGAVSNLARSSDAETAVQVSTDEIAPADALSSDSLAAEAAPEAEKVAPSPGPSVDPDATVEATGSELSASDVVTPSDVHTSRADAQALADQVGEDTGRTVVLVFQEESRDGRAVTWTHTEIPGRAPFVASDEAVLVSRVTDWIADQRDPDSFELIVDE